MDTSVSTNVTHSPPRVTLRVARPVWIRPSCLQPKTTGLRLSRVLDEEHARILLSVSVIILVQVKFRLIFVRNTATPDENGHQHGTVIKYATKLIVSVFCASKIPISLGGKLKGKQF